MSGAYYNEIDPYAAAWLRNLIAAGHIAPGDVDERSIVDVRADDLRGYTQCHFFAGIGAWSYALRLAGWPDDRHVWTGSCPCQPFSAAGRSGGFDDSRHLWPNWAGLILERGAHPVFGEQVASADGLAWLDFVCADLEAAGYAVGSVDTCAAGFGAPHIRQRLYFVADAGRRGFQRGREYRELRREISPDGDQAQPCAVQDAARGRSEARELAYADGRDAGAEGLQRSGQHGQQPQDGGANPGVLADPYEQQAELVERDRGLQGQSKRQVLGGRGFVGDAERAERRPHQEITAGRTAQPGATNGFWRDADWLPCTDGKARPVEPGTFPLAHGAPARVGRLRAYGNAINAEAAREFIRVYIDERIP